MYPETDVILLRCPVDFKSYELRYSAKKEYPKPKSYNAKKLWKMRGKIRRN